MTNKTFKEFVSRIETYYSTSSNPVRIDEWAIKEYYNACFCVFDKDAKAFYSEIVSVFKFFPKVSEFREVAEKYRDKQNKTRHINTEFCYCCMNTGIVPYFKKGLKPFLEHEYEFVSRCYCESGKNRPDWPLCTAVVTQGELEWKARENYKKFGNIKSEEKHRAKEYVTTFIKGFGI